MPSSYKHHISKYDAYYIYGYNLSLTKLKFNRTSIQTMEYILIVIYVWHILIVIYCYLELFKKLWIIPFTLKHIPSSLKHRPAISAAP